MPFDFTNFTETKHDLDTYWGRLRHLADFIETLPPEKVDMGDYYCGTAACALGWASRMPEFQTRGMPPNVDASTTTDTEFFGLGALAVGSPAFFCFGTGSQFRYLGRPYTPADVARHLRETADELETAARELNQRPAVEAAE